MAWHIFPIWSSGEFQNSFEWNSKIQNHSTLYGASPSEDKRQWSTLEQSIVLCNVWEFNKGLLQLFSCSLFIPEPLFNLLLASLIWSCRICTQSLGPGSLSTWLAVQYFSVKTERKCEISLNALTNKTSRSETGTYPKKKKYVAKRQWFYSRYFQCPYYIPLVKVELGTALTT